MTSKPDDLRAYFKAAAAAKLQVKLGDHSAVALAEDAVGQDVPPRYRVDRVASRSVLPRERFISSGAKPTFAKHGRLLSANFGRSSRMTSATPVASISRYRRNAIIRYGNRAAIFSELTEPRKPDVCGGATRHARQGVKRALMEVRYVSSNGSTRQFAYQASPDGAS
jgi:hypothetical protein